MSAPRELIQIPPIPISRAGKRFPRRLLPAAVPQPSSASTQIRCRLHRARRACLSLRLRAWCKPATSICRILPPRSLQSGISAPRSANSRFTFSVSRQINPSLSLSLLNNSFFWNRLWLGPVLRVARRVQNLLRGRKQRSRCQNPRVSPPLVRLVSVQ